MRTDAPTQQSPADHREPSGAAYEAAYRVWIAWRRRIGRPVDGKPEARPTGTEGSR